MWKHFCLTLSGPASNLRGNFYYITNSEPFLVANFVITKICSKRINFRYLDSACTELSSDLSFIQKLSCYKRVKYSFKESAGKKNAGLFYEVCRYQFLFLSSISAILPIDYFITGIFYSHLP